MKNEILNMKPLSQGRELKYSCSIRPNQSMRKPLSQGRELKSALEGLGIAAYNEAPLAGA